MLLHQDNLDAETNMVRDFCQYLESEGIVSNYETKDLLLYEGGVKAQRAITAIFNQVDAQLQTKGFRSESVLDKPGDWPG